MLYNNVPVDKNLSAELVINAENSSIVNNVITIGEENFLNIALVISSFTFIAIGLIVLIKSKNK